METKTYINRDERLGDCVECTLSDVHKVLAIYGINMTDEEILNEYDLIEVENEL